MVDRARECLLPVGRRGGLLVEPLVAPAEQAVALLRGPQGGDQRLECGNRLDMAAGRRQCERALLGDLGDQPQFDGQGVDEFEHRIPVVRRVGAVAQHQHQCDRDGAGHAAGAAGQHQLLGARHALGLRYGPHRTHLGLKRREQRHLVFHAGGGALVHLRRVADDGLVHRRHAALERRDRALDRLLNRRRRGGGHLALGQRVAHRAHLRQVEQLLRPIGREQHAAGALRGVANADFVVDVAVGDRHVGKHQVGEVEALEHLRDDHRAGVLIGAHRLVAERGDDRHVGAVPKRVEVDLGRALAGLGLGGLAAVGHHHEAQGLDHRALTSRGGWWPASGCGHGRAAPLASGAACRRGRRRPGRPRGR